jgi:phospho-N-acetylmuramoyl-pentapeptide-transferase
MTTQLLIAFVVSFALVAVLAPAWIRYLRRRALQQHAYEDAPQTHQKKTGTPTLGGVLFLIAPLVAAALTRDATALAYGLLIVGSGAVGYVDDTLAIRSGRNRGLGARTKFLATAVVGAAFLGLVAAPSSDAPALLFAGPVPYWLWYALSLAVILATTHAVNLTDGLDGLASGTIVPPLALLAFIALRQGATSAATVAVAVLGAVLGFLIYNRHPAKIFMGDTGSLALGAALAGAAILTGAQLLLLLIGGVFVAETLSVIIQVTSYKTTKRRVFRMSPLHHHFELGGWPETRVTSSFWLASLFLGIIGFVIVVRA